MEKKEILEEYTQILEKKKSDLEKNLDPSDLIQKRRLENTVSRWKRVIEQPNTSVFRLEDKFEYKSNTTTSTTTLVLTAYVTLVPFEKGDRKYVWVHELQVPANQRLIKMIKNIISFVQESYPTATLYGLLQETDAETMKIYESLGAQLSQDWFQEIHPEYVREEGWCSIEIVPTEL